MHKLWCILLCALTFFTIKVDAATTPIKFRRICNSGNDNVLFWYQSPDTCSSFSKYIIWFRNGKSGPFSKLDSISNRPTETYIHLNANSLGAKDWYYYIENIDSCGPNVSINSDIVGVDQSQNYPSYIDSVSVDITTNNVFIGWGQNKAPDFALYDPFFQKTQSPATYDYIIGTQGTRDTFVIDNNIAHNPSAGPLEYDLGTRDSCGNTGPFGENPHKTIYLQVGVDTCTKTTSLSWTPYSYTYLDNGRTIQVGWKAVLKYYIFKGVNGGAMYLLDSVAGTILTYKDVIQLGQTIRYYIRAKKDTTILVTSSSNLSQIVTRLRVDPINTKLVCVSVDPTTNNQISVSINNTNEEWLKYNVYRSPNTTSIPSVAGTLINPKNGQTQNIYKDVVDATISEYYYQIHSINLCGIDVNSTVTSNSIFLSTVGSGTQNTLTWNQYSYWDVGVEKYLIYRGLKYSDGSITYSLLDFTSPTTNTYINSSPITDVGVQGLCYYVQAIQSSGVEKGNSNSSCIMGELSVFVPNAFNPFGVNKTFKPGGSYIDYIKSSMEIYDRWGGKITEMTDITLGWDGRNSNGQYASSGVYLYKIKIIGTNGTEKTKTGFVTLLD